MIDIVIVHTEKSKEYTEYCIESIKNTTKVPYTIYKVEGDEISPFTYNKALNLGASRGKNPYILFCNNDLLFTEGWDSIISDMKRFDVRSASPYCTETHHKWWSKEEVPNVSIGHTMGKLFAGWCFCWERSLWEEIKLSEEYQFWCSDNVTVDTLIDNNIKHALFKKSVVIHKYSKSMSKLDKDTKRAFTHFALRKYLTDKKDTKALKSLEKDIKYEQNRRR